MSVMMRNGVQYAGEPTDRLDSIEEIIGDGQQSVGSDLTDAVTQLNSSLANKIAGRHISTGGTLSITFSTYNSAAIIFGIINATNYIMYLYGDGYIVPIKTLNNVNVSLSSNYKTISITNNYASSTLWVGVLNTFNVDMSIN